MGNLAVKSEGRREAETGWAGRGGESENSGTLKGGFWGRLVCGLGWRWENREV